jgi:hypothetical protein
MSKALTIVIAAAAGSASGYFAASGAQQVKVDSSFRAKSFELTDEQGKLRGHWAIAENGAASFIMTGPTGGSQIIARSDSNGCTLALTDMNGNPRAEIGIDGASPVVRVMGAAGEPLAWIAAEASGESEIGVGRRTSNATIASGSDGSLSMRFGGADPLALLLAPANGSPSFAMSSPDRKGFASFEFERNAPIFKVRSEEQAGVTQAVMQAGSLSFSRATGEDARMRLDPSGDSSVELRSRGGEQKSLSTKSP